jgi:hypothetical protein
MVYIFALGKAAIAQDEWKRYVQKREHKLLDAFQIV